MKMATYRQNLLLRLMISGISFLLRAIALLLGIPLMILASWVAGIGYLQTRLKTSSTICFPDLQQRESFIYQQETDEDMMNNLQYLSKTSYSQVMN